MADRKVRLSFAKNQEHDFNIVAEALGHCRYCKKEFADKRDKYTHLGRWGRCPLLAEDITIVAAPLCACGCGKRVEASKRNPGEYNKFIKGHNKRPKER